jgi:hypothetical protein
MPLVAPFRHVDGDRRGTEVVARSSMPCLVLPTGANYGHDVSWEHWICGLRLPSKPASSLRGLIRRAFQAFARSLDLRIGCTVTSRPHFCCRS